MMRITLRVLQFQANDRLITHKHTNKMNTIKQIKKMKNLRTPKQVREEMNNCCVCGEELKPECIEDGGNICEDCFYEL